MKICFSLKSSAFLDVLCHLVDLIWIRLSYSAESVADDACYSSNGIHLFSFSCHIHHGCWKVWHLSWENFEAYPSCSWTPTWLAANRESINFGFFVSIFSKISNCLLRSSAVPCSFGANWRFFPSFGVFSPLISGWNFPAEAVATLAR